MDDLLICTDNKGQPILHEDEKLIYYCTKNM